MLQAVFTLLLASLLYLPAIAAEPDHAATVRPAYSQSYSPERDPFQDGQAAIALARETQRHILIEIGGEWCVWCKRLDAFLKNNPVLKQQFFENFVLLKVNVSDENRNETFRAALPPTNGFPHFFVSDQTGKVLYSLDNTELLTEQHYDRLKLQAFIQRWGTSSTPESKHDKP